MVLFSIFKLFLVLLGTIGSLLAASLATLLVVSTNNASVTMPAALSIDPPAILSIALPATPPAALLDTAALLAVPPSDPPGTLPVTQSDMFAALAAPSYLKHNLLLNQTLQILSCLVLQETKSLKTQYVFTPPFSTKSPRLRNQANSKGYCGRSYWQT